MYEVSFYTKSGKVKEFLDSCLPSLRVKILRQLTYIQQYGLHPAIPNIKKITNTPLWELRILGRDNIRIICTVLSIKEIKVLHIFRKKKQKTPAKEINISLKRYKEVLDR